MLLGIGQGWRIVGVTELIERRLASRKLLHAGTPLMAYCVGNARVVPRGNATLIIKEASKGRIDPSLALLTERGGRKGNVAARST